MQKSQPIYREHNFLGDILFLVAHSQMHHHFKMHKIKTIFIPPVRYGQYRVFYMDSKPYGFGTWAWVSDEILHKLQNENYLLEPNEWQSGKNLWLADWVSPFGKTREMVKAMKDYLKKNDAKDVNIAQWYRPSKRKQGYAIRNKKTV